MGLSLASPLTPGRQFAVVPKTKVTETLALRMAARLHIRPYRSGTLMTSAFPRLAHRGAILAQWLHAFPIESAPYATRGDVACLTAAIPTCGMSIGDFKYGGQNGL